VSVILVDTEYTRRYTDRSVLLLQLAFYSEVLGLCITDIALAKKEVGKLGLDIS
jgi:hypothetical protein